jgi:death-on-curing protein
VGRTIHYLDLADFLLISEAVLGVDAGELIHATRLDLAESALCAPQASFAGQEFYPLFEDKAAVLCSRLIRNHPLLDGNKRVGYLCLVEFAERNGFTWTPPAEDGPSGDETVRVILAVAAGTMDGLTLARWITARMSGATEDS